MTKVIWAAMLSVIIGMILMVVFTYNNKLSSTEYIMEVYDDGYYIYCNEGEVGFIPLSNSPLDSLMVDYNQ